MRTTQSQSQLRIQCFLNNWCCILEHEHTHTRTSIFPLCVYAYLFVRSINCFEHFHWHFYSSTQHPSYFVHLIPQQQTVWFCLILQFLLSMCDVTVTVIVTASNSGTIILEMYKRAIYCLFCIFIVILQLASDALPHDFLACSQAKCFKIDSNELDCHSPS